MCLIRGAARYLPMVEREPLSKAEFTSLQEVAKGIGRASIPLDHRVHLIKDGLIYNLLGSLRMTTAGRHRLTVENWIKVVGPGLR